MALRLLDLFVLLAGLVVSALCLPEPRNRDAGDCRHQFRHLNSCDDASTNTEVKGISPELLADMHLMAEYAAAVYLPANYNSTATPLACTEICPGSTEGSCPQMEAAGATTLHGFQDTPKFDDHGYIALDDTNHLIILAFRGSQSFINWIENLKVWRSESDFCKGCGVHAGFLEQWVSLRDMIIPNVEKAVDDHPDYRFIILGHSLGGALATIAAGDFRRRSDWFLAHTELFSYGSPRVGDFRTARFLSEQSEKSYRVTANNDPIPRLPITSIGYMHTSPEYFITRNPDGPKPEDVTVLTGYYNSHGNSGQDTNIFSGMDHHLHYFERLLHCDKAPEDIGDDET